MNYYRNYNVPLFYFDNLVKHDQVINHFVTTRNRQLPASSQNQYTIGLNGAVDNKVVLENRQEIAETMGFSNMTYVFASQVHGNKVAVVRDEDRGQGAFDRESYLPDVDAMITIVPNICLIAQAADCVPILLYDPVKPAIGVAHAGWKGTILKIAAATVKAMMEEFRSNPSEIIVGIGPSIGPCCYEVGEEVVEMVKANFTNPEKLVFENKNYSRLVFNLWESNRISLIEAGIKPENIEMANLCSRCNNDIFFSARAGDKGRFGAGIMIKAKV